MAIASAASTRAIWWQDVIIGLEADEALLTLYAVVVVAHQSSAIRPPFLAAAGWQGDNIARTEEPRSPRSDQPAAELAPASRRTAALPPRRAPPAT
eukprot:COSAG01_NODE_168_length_23206_cov_14.301467_12_plen_96_part_00